MINPDWQFYLLGYNRIDDIAIFRCLMFEYMRIGELKVVYLFGYRIWRWGL